MIRVGVDIGNSKISCIVCDINSKGKIKILSFIASPTNNVKKSSIINIEKIKQEIKEILSKASKESQTDIASVRVNIPVVDSLTNYYTSEVSISNDKVTELHLKTTINESEILEPIDNYKIILRSVLNYQLDNQTNILDPRGMYGENLKVFFYKLAIRNNYIRTIDTIFKQLNINIESYIPTPLSSALASLKEDEKDLGSINIDLGSGSTSISIFENKKLIFLDSIPIGGQNITKDIARGLSTTIESAERLKTLYGSVITNPSDDFELIDVQILGNDNNQFNQINRSQLNAIIKPRVEETLELIRQKLKDHNLDKKPIRNLVLTGGGSLLEGIEQYAQTIFDSKTRIIEQINGFLIEDKFNKPQFSQTIGLMHYNEKDYKFDFFTENIEKIEKKTIFSRFSSWLDQYI
tara:strand:+ start:2627 stop:3850 length:1224 start_codon:yes stop_codon:yes gene_type:complete